MSRSSVKKARVRKTPPARPSEERRSGRDRRSAQDRREMPRPEGRRTNGGRRSTDPTDI